MPYSHVWTNFEVNLYWDQRNNVLINHTGIPIPFCTLVIDLRVLAKLRVDKADRKGGGAAVVTTGVSSLTELLITNESYIDEDNPENKLFSSRGECNGAEREREREKTKHKNLMIHNKKDILITNDK